MVETKSVPVTKRMVWEAFKKVKKNQGAAGVDKQTIAVFEERLSDNLYVLWNRMTSGSYYPPSVRIVEIPKKDGKKRRLGIPTVSDRIAQMVLKEYLEPRYEAIFNQNSYGYRPNLKAHDALTKCINNCYKFCWVIDLDIKAFFDNLDHELLLKMLQVETKETWVVRYIKRWLEAPAENEGETIRRTKGTPQGGVISPLLANVYLHYVFDLWMKIKQQKNPFERYADDVIVHCQTREEAEALLEMIKERLKNFGLEVNAEKTKIIYCKKNRRNEKYDYVSFDFLGYQFKPRLSMTKEKEFFLGYGAGISRQAKKSIGQKIRKLKITRWTHLTLEDIAKELNPKLRGWINYYGFMNKRDMRKIFVLLNDRLIKWYKNKYRIISYGKAAKILSKIGKEKIELFAHWKVGYWIY